MKPYWQNEEHGLSIYCADNHRVLNNRQAMSRLGTGPVALVTDPPWPRGTGDERVSNVCAVTDQLRELMNDLGDALQFQQLRRCVMHLGCDTDPRILEHIPLTRLPFLRVCDLDYAQPHCKGRILYGGDKAYVFGEPPAARKGQGVLPGRCLYKVVEKRVEGHPHPRRLTHVEWLVRWFTEPTDTILDPFLGSGTTLVACYRLGRRGVGIEPSEEYCELATERLEQEMQQLRLPETVAPAGAPVQLEMENDA